MRCPGVYYLRYDEIFRLEMRILYILQHFPWPSETFILNEMKNIIRMKNKIYVLSVLDSNWYGNRGQFEYDVLIRHTVYLTDIIGKRRTQQDHYLPERFAKEKDYISRELMASSFFNSKVSQYAMAICDIVELIKKESIQHIHCHFGDNNALLASIVAKIAAVPFSVTLHAYDIFKNNELNLREVCAKASNVITISEYNKKYINEKYGIDPKRINVVRAGIDIRSFEFNDRRSAGAFRVLAVARLVEKKGIRYLIDACAYLKSMKMSFRCDIVGDDPCNSLRENLKSQINDLSLSGLVTLHGVQEHSVVRNFFSEADVFVAPCVASENGDQDGIPVSIMEAMASGIPVISTNISGIPELVKHGETGLIANQKDGLSIAMAIIEIHKRRLLSGRLIANARKLVRNNHSVEESALKMCEVIFNPQKCDQ